MQGNQVKNCQHNCHIGRGDLLWWRQSHNIRGTELPSTIPVKKKLQRYFYYFILIGCYHLPIQGQQYHK